MSNDNDRNNADHREPRLDPNQNGTTTTPSLQDNLHVSILSTSQNTKTTTVSPIQVSNGLLAPSPFTFTSEPNSSCPICGKEAKFLCTRCRVQKYCSPSCQQIHWSTIHKRECQSIEGRMIIVDVQDDPNHNNHSDDVQLVANNTTVFILKVQVALNSKVSPMMAYDYSRSVYYLINATNCKKSQLLDHTIRTTGDVQGSKAYFNAKIRARDSKLIIFLDQRHANLEW